MCVGRICEQASFSAVTQRPRAAIDPELTRASDYFAYATFKWRKCEHRVYV